MVASEVTSAHLPVVAVVAGLWSRDQRLHGALLVAVATLWSPVVAAVATGRVRAVGSLAAVGGQVSECGQSPARHTCGHG